MPKNLLGRRLVQGQEGTRRPRPLIRAAHPVEHGLHQTVLARRAVQVDQGEIVFAGLRQQGVEFRQQIEKSHAVAPRAQGFGHAARAVQRDFALTGPAARNQKNLHATPILTAPTRRVQ